MTVTFCPLCAGTALDVVVEMSGTPVHQHITFDSAAEARRCVRGDVHLTLCRNCGFTFNAAFDPSRVDYSTRYDNAQEHSPAFRAYLDSLTADLVSRHALAGKTIVEIGCGQGAFLARLCRAADARGVGFDPSFDPARGLSGAALTFVPYEYDPAHPLAAGDVICGRHVIEHIADPAGFVRAIAGATRGRAAMLCIETPRLEWIFERRAFWDVFYEHCSYFAMPVLAALVRAHGFRVTRHQSTFGAQYQWLEAERESPGARAPVDDSAAIERLKAAADSFQREWERWRDNWRAQIATFAAAGPCVMWGGGAKGVTALNVLDPDRTAVTVVIDVNPRKAGRYVPGTGHPIVAPSQLPTLGARTVLVANGNYLAEIRDTMAQIGHRADFVVLDETRRSADARML